METVTGAGTFPAFGASAEVAPVEFPVNITFATSWIEAGATGPVMEGIDEFKSTINATFPTFSAAGDFYRFVDEDAYPLVYVDLGGAGAALEGWPITADQSDPPGEIAFGFQTFPAFTSEAAVKPVVTVAVDASFPPLSASAVGGMPVDIEGSTAFPAFTAAATATKDARDLTASAGYPAFGVQGEINVPMGGIVEAAYPKFSVASSVNMSATASGAIDFPAFTAYGDGLEDSRMLSASALFPTFGVAGELDVPMGAMVDAGYPAFGASGEVNVPAGVLVEAALPKFSSAATVAMTNFAEGVAGFPVFTVEATGEGPNDYLHAVFPAFGAAGEVAVPIQGAAYAVFPAFGLESAINVPDAVLGAAKYPAFTGAGEINVPDAVLGAATFGHFTAGALVFQDVHASGDAGFPSFGFRGALGTTNKVDANTAFPAFQVRVLVGEPIEVADALVYPTFGAQATVLPFIALEGSVALGVVAAHGEAEHVRPQFTLARNIPLEPVSAAGAITARPPAALLSGAVSLGALSASGALSAYPPFEATGEAAFPSFEAAVETYLAYKAQGELLFPRLRVSGAAQAEEPPVMVNKHQVLISRYATNIAFSGYSFDDLGDLVADLTLPSPGPTLGSSYSMYMSKDGRWAFAMGYRATGTPANSDYMILHRKGKVWTGYAFNPLPLYSSSGARLQSAAFSPDGTYLFVGFTLAAPYSAVFKRTGTTYTLLTTGYTPPIQVQGLQGEFSADGNYLYNSYGQIIYVMKRTGDTWSQVSTTTAAASVGNLTTTADGNFLVTLEGSAGSYQLVFYSIGVDSLTKYASYGVGTFLSFSLDAKGETISLPSSSAPYWKIVKRVGTTFTDMALPSGLMSNGSATTYRTSLTGDGKHLFILSNAASPYQQYLTRVEDTWTLRTMAGVSNPAGVHALPPTILAGQLRFYDTAMLSIISNSLHTTNLKVALLSNAADYAAGHTTLAQVTNSGAYEVYGQGWPQGGIACPANIVEAGSGVVDFVVSDISSAAMTGVITPYSAVIYDDADPNDRPLAFIDFEEPVPSVNGESLIFDFPARLIRFGALGTAEVS